MVFENPETKKAEQKEEESAFIDCRQMQEYYYRYFHIASEAETKQDGFEEIAFLVAFLALRENPDEQVEAGVFAIRQTFMMVELIKKMDYFAVKEEDLEDAVEGYEELTRVSARNPDLYNRMVQLTESKRERVMLAGMRLGAIKLDLVRDYKYWLAGEIHENFKGKHLARLLSCLDLTGALIEEYGDVFMGEIIELFGEQVEILNHFEEVGEDRPDSAIMKKLYGGEHISTVMSMRDKKKDVCILNNKPGDFNHLLRNMIIYRLTYRCKLMVRQFLSIDMSKIFVLIKATDEELQKFQLSYGIVNETELGAIDLFSLEPVDSKMRPLRIHQFIRETAFRRKFGLLNQEPDSNELAKPIENVL
jgi:hypothetical protein